MYNQQYGGAYPQYNNPVLEQQINRLNQFQNINQQYPQNYPQQPQIQPQTPTPQNIIRPVTSLEEIRAITPNFDGSKMYFEDVTNGKLYIKYLGVNGLPVTDIFEKTTITNTDNNVNSTDFVSRKEFDEIKAKISQYENIFNELMGGSNNVQQSNATTTNA